MRKPLGTIYSDLTRHLDIVLTILIALTACSNPPSDKTLTSSADTSIVNVSTQNLASSSARQEANIQKDQLPIHGALNQGQIARYYPNILDTIKDIRTIGSEPIDIQTSSDMYVSIFHNTGTFDQMFLCTHDRHFNLQDSYYIGKSTMFDKTSHTIEYNIESDDQIEFHHVDWGYVKRNSDNEIDTVKYRKYTLRVTATGKIEKM